jgi:hypothetical protein
MFKFHKSKMFKYTTKCKLGLVHYALCIVMNTTYTICERLENLEL